MKLLLKKSLAVLGAILFIGGGVSLAQKTHDEPQSSDSPPPAFSPVPLPTRNDYMPPVTSFTRLGKINDALSYATPVERQFEGLNQMLRLPDGTLFVDADLDTDADGSPRATEIDPRCGQLATSLNFPDEDGQRRYVNAETVPYIVLPVEFYKDMGIELGDVAAVIWNDRLVYALFADAGPKDHIGEGSIALSEALGFDPWGERDGGRQIVRGIEEHVLMFVFPNSASPDITPENVNQRTSTRAWSLFQALGGKVG